MSTTYLFDIDGTLLSSGRAGQKAMEEALRVELGVENLDYEIPTAGRTDRAIITDLFRWHDEPLTETRFQQFRDCYFSLLPNHLQAGGGMVLPGVTELLAKITAESNEFTGLMTGNFQTSGWLKVRHFSLDHHFSFGVFGDVHVDRDDLARLAWSELIAKRPELEPNHIWVIGDTPADVQCARAIGARVLAVATGRYSREELEATDPDATVDDFQRTDDVLDILLHG
ncbi:MAG: haloacid dehalogenase [Planctomyces sp.]|nr:haloacid dehalogenase [Planctomyces sp.]